MPTAAHPPAPCVAIVGASPKPERYSHQALVRYRAAGWTVWPVHPAAQPIDGLTTYADLGALPGRPSSAPGAPRSRPGSAQQLAPIARPSK